MDWRVWLLGTRLAAHMLVWECLTAGLVRAALGLHEKSAAKKMGIPSGRQAPRCDCGMPWLVSCLLACSSQHLMVCLMFMHATC